MYLYKVKYNHNSKETEIVTPRKISDSDKRLDGRYTVKDVHGDPVSFVSYQLVKEFDDNVEANDISEVLSSYLDFSDFDVDYDCETEVDEMGSPEQPMKVKSTMVRIHSVALVKNTDPSDLDLTPPELEYLKERPVKLTLEGEFKGGEGCTAEFSVYLKIVKGKLVVVDHDIEAY